MNVVRIVCIGIVFGAGAASLPVLTFGGNSFTEYEAIKHVLSFLNDSLPPELKSDEVARSKIWRSWLTEHDRDIRQRLRRGDEDTIVNWLLFGTSFTRQPRALLDVAANSDRIRDLISTRSAALVTALASSENSERLTFARRLLMSQGFAFNTAKDRARLERHFAAEVNRVFAERQEYIRREETFPRGDIVAQLMVQSTLFRDRGLSLDTSILPSFAIDQALETMKKNGLLPGHVVRRVAIIGPGLDFADKNSGSDFYPVQTLQPFTTMDSLVRLGLTDASEIEVTTFDISPRVNDHIANLQHDAKTGAGYTLRLPTDPGSPWTPDLTRYWKTMGNQIGSEMPLRKPGDMPNGFEIRGVTVRPNVAARLTAIDFNVVTETWQGTGFDLVIATNVLVYYDKLDQSLAFAAIEAMLRPGGFFLTNNAIVELPVSKLRSVGVVTVNHSAEKTDHVFWYRRTE